MKAIQIDSYWRSIFIKFTASRRIAPSGDAVLGLLASKKCYAKIKHN